MELELFEEILKQLPPGRRRIYLQKTGEPLLHPQIGEMLRLLREARPEYEIALHSNASHLSGEKIPLLLRYADFVSFSIFGFDPERYAAAHGRDDFQRFHRNLGAFYEAWRKVDRRPKVYFDVVRCPENAGLSPEEIFQALQSRYPAFNVGLHFPFNFQGVLPGYDLDAFKHLSQEQFPVCIWPWVMAVIHWDGKLGYCVGDAYETAFLGDLRKDSLMDLWNGPAYRAFRRGHLERAFDRLAQEEIHCGRCNWLFGLKSQSAENLCLTQRKESSDPLEALPGGTPVSGAQHLELGLRRLQRGELAEAMRAFVLAELLNEDLAERAQAWQVRVRKIWTRRADLESWESALNQEGLSLATVHQSHYSLSKDPLAQISDAHQRLGEIILKEGDL